MMKKIWAVLLSICLMISLAAPALAAPIKTSGAASTLRLESVDGTAQLKNGSGKQIKTTNGTRLYNGYELTTQKSSYAYVSLDDTKAIKLDASTSTEVFQSGKKLEMKVNSGQMFFNVTAPLKSDEALNIRTSTMVTGVRGTSGWIEVANRYITRVSLLEGELTITSVDPLSGVTRSVTIHGGQTATVVYHGEGKDYRSEITVDDSAGSGSGSSSSGGRPSGSAGGTSGGTSGSEISRPSVVDGSAIGADEEETIENLIDDGVIREEHIVVNNPGLTVETLQEEDVPGFVALEVKKDEALQQEIEENSPLSVPAIIGDAEERLEAENDAAEAADQAIQETVEQLTADVVNPVFEEQADATAGGSSGGSSGGGATPTVAVNAASWTELNEAISTYNNASNTSNMVINLQDESGDAVMIDGADADGSLPAIANKGDLSLTLNLGQSDLLLNGPLVNNGNLTITNTQGRISVGDGWLSDNQNVIENKGNLTHNAGQIEVPVNFNGVYNHAGATYVMAGANAEIISAVGTQAEGTPAILVWNEGMFRMENGQISVGENGIGVLYAGDDDGGVTMIGGTVNVTGASAQGIQTGAGTNTFSGGSINVTGANATGLSIYAEVTLNGTNITASAANSVGVSVGGGTTIFSGGSVTAETGATAVRCYSDEYIAGKIKSTIRAAESDSVFVIPGEDGASRLPAGYEVVQTEDGTYYSLTAVSTKSAWQTFTEQVAAFNSGTESMTITLDGDITPSADDLKEFQLEAVGYRGTNTSTLTIDLAGHSLTLGTELENDGKLIIKDTSAKETGQILGTASTLIRNDGSLDLQGGTITISESTTYRAIDNNGSLSISGGTVVVEKGTGIYLWDGDSSELVMNGGTISVSGNGEGVHVFQGTALTLNRGTIIATAETASCIGVEDLDTLTLNGTVVTGLNGENLLVTTLSDLRDSFRATGPDENGYYTLEKASNNDAPDIEDKTVTVAGYGDFAVGLMDFDGTTNTTIVLETDDGITDEILEAFGIPEADLVIPPGNGTLTIDLAGHSLTLGKILENNGNLIIKDSSADGTGQISGYAYPLIHNTVNLDLQGGTIRVSDSSEGIRVSEYAVLTLSGGTIIATADTATCIGAANNAQITLEDTVVTGPQGDKLLVTSGESITGFTVTGPDGNGYYTLTYDPNNGGSGGTVEAFALNLSTTTYAYDRAQNAVMAGAATATEESVTAGSNYQITAPAGTIIASVSSKVSGDGTTVNISDDRKTATVSMDGDKDLSLVLFTTPIALDDPTVNELRTIVAYYTEYSRAYANSVSPNPIITLDITGDISFGSSGSSSDTVSFLSNYSNYIVNLSGATSLASGITLTTAEGTQLNVTDGCTFTNNGTISGAGTLNVAPGATVDNYGTIQVGTADTVGTMAVESGGALNNLKDDTSSTYGKLTVADGSALNVAGTITTTASRIENAGTMTVTGTVSGENFYDRYGNQPTYSTTIYNTGTLTVNGGSVSHITESFNDSVSSAIYTDGGTVTVKEYSTVEGYTYAIRIANDGIVNVEGGFVDGYSCSIEVGSGCTLNITGGTVRGGSEVINNDDSETPGSVTMDGGTLFLNDGAGGTLIGGTPITFNSGILKGCYEDFINVEKLSGLESAEPVVAVGNYWVFVKDSASTTHTFTALASASALAEAIANYQIVNLLAGGELSESTITLASGQTLNLSGGTLTIGENAGLVVAGTLIVSEDASIINEGTLSISGSVTTSSTIWNYGTMTVSGSVVGSSFPDSEEDTAPCVINNTGNLTLDGGSVRLLEDFGCAINAAGGEVVVKDGSSVISTEVGIGSPYESGGIITIQGGQISANTAIFVSGAVNMSGGELIGTYAGIWDCSIYDSENPTYGANIVVTGGTISVQGDYAAGIRSDNPATVISVGADAQIIATTITAGEGEAYGILTECFSFTEGEYCSVTVADGDPYDPTGEGAPDDSVYSMAFDVDDSIIQATTADVIFVLQA